MKSEIEDVNLTSDNHLANLPLFFIIKLTDKLGYYPQDNYSSNNIFFNLQEAKFGDIFIESPYIMNKIESEYFHNLLSKDDYFSIPYNIRSSLLKKLVTYLQINNEHIRKIDSLEILNTLLR